MSNISKDKHTCSECDAFVAGESKRGHCHLNPPSDAKRDDQVDAYPMVDGCGKGCMQHSKRGKKGK